MILKKILENNLLYITREEFPESLALLALLLLSLDSMAPGRNCNIKCFTIKIRYIFTNTFKDLHRNAAWEKVLPLKHTFEVSTLCQMVCSFYKYTIFAVKI